MASAEDVLVTGSARTDFRYDDEFDFSQVDVWFDTRAYYRNFDAAARLRIHQTIGDPLAISIEDIDRRHMALTLPQLDILAGNYYVTFGNGVLLRTLEQRFVTLNRVDRAFNLDRNLDGVRVRGEAGPIRVILLSGQPKVNELTVTGGALPRPRDDLLQGGQGTVSVWSRLQLAFAYQLYETPTPGPGDDREQEDFVSYQARSEWPGFGGAFEYAEKRHRPFTPRGIARYARVDGATGPVGASLEWKSYRNFFFEYNQLPTLVCTQESVLLNRSTHVVLPDDERGVQAEIVYSPSLFSTALVNLSGAQGSDAHPGREYREVYVEGRTEREGVGGGRLALDWTRDMTKFVDDQWTAALELEAFLNSRNSLILDLELQAVEKPGNEYANQFVQLAFSRAGLLTVAGIAEHSTDRELEKNNWFSASIDLRLSGAHDLSVWLGSRPPGIVCSGGFCFFSEEFEGLEARLLSRF